MERRILLVVAMISLFIGACPFARAAADPYNAGIAAAEAVRHERNDAAFRDLTVIDPSKTRALIVSDGMGGTKTIQAVNVITLTSYTAPYATATSLQRYTVDATSNYRSNLWTTVEGDAKAYLRQKGMPVTDNVGTTKAMLESLGMGDWSGYKVLSIWVEPKYITRPSYNPDIASNAAPTWNAATGGYDFTNVNAATLPNFLGIAPVNKTAGSYTRPFNAFAGTAEYQNWLNAWSASSYDIGAGREFPYTGLGWTWNWNTDPALNGFALSEFLVNGNAEYYFKSLRPTLAYLFPVIARNANQSSVAIALDGIFDSATGDARTTLDAIVALDDGAVIASTFEEASPARLNLLTRQIMMGIDDVADKVSDRFGPLTSTIDSSTNRNGSAWATTDVSWTKGNSGAGGLGADTTSEALVLGWEKRKAQSVSGFAISHNTNDLTWHSSTGNADAGVTFLTGYCGRQLGKWTLGAELGLGLVSIQANRQIPTLGQQLSGEDSANGMLAGITAYLPVCKKNWTLTPFVGLLYTRLEQDAYTESGGGLAMNIGSRSVDVLRGAVGVSADNRVAYANNRSLTRSLRLRWLCPLTDRNSTVSGFFVADPATPVSGVDCAVPGNTIQASIAVTGSFGTNRNLSLGYDYRNELDGGLRNHSISLDYSVDF